MEKRNGEVIRVSIVRSEIVQFTKLKYKSPKNLMVSKVKH